VEAVQNFERKLNSVSSCVADRYYNHDLT